MPLELAEDVAAAGDVDDWEIGNEEGNGVEIGERWVLEIMILRGIIILEGNCREGEGR